MSISPNYIVNKVLRILKEGTVSFRAEMNKEVHLLDISYNAMKLSDPKLTEEDYATFLSAIYASGKYRASSSLEDAYKFAKTVKGYSAIINDFKYGMYLIRKGYNNLQAEISPILKSISHTGPLLSTKDDGTVQANIGHIYNPKLQNTRSPLSNELMSALKRVPLNAAGPILEELGFLADAHDFEASYQFQRADYDVDGFSKIIGKMTVLVTLHSFALNNKLANNVEGTIPSRLTEYFNSSEFKNHIMEAQGSKSILQELNEGLLAVLQERSYKSPHPKKPPEKIVSAPNKSRKVVKDKTPALRTVQGQFYSLASLQILLNTHLQHVIAANMGDGGRRDILNYRTGRFATSAKVERLTQSREGAVTAFYSYMKNPYGTFEPGYAQGSPKTRDPKILIGKSIKEIAAIKVGNRMRAVLI